MELLTYSNLVTLSGGACCKCYCYHTAKENFLDDAYLSGADCFQNPDNCPADCHKRGYRYYWYISQDECGV